MRLAAVDTQVVHGYISCGAEGAITGVGNVPPREVLYLLHLCQLAANGDFQVQTMAQDLMTNPAYRLMQASDKF